MISHKKRRPEKAPFLPAAITLTKNSHSFTLEKSLIRQIRFVRIGLGK